jgi:hypothetical protein
MPIFPYSFCSELVALCLLFRLFPVVHFGPEVAQTKLAKVGFQLNLGMK